MSTTYDAIVVGASFAGLSVAGQLRGRRVLLIDRLPIGARQTSACATYLRVLEKLDCLDSLELVHPTIYVRTTSRTIAYPMPTPWCTFDYEKFCRSLFDRMDVEFLRARVISLSEGRVLTDRGAFSGDYLVDCSGWSAALSAARRRPDRRLNLGAEATVNFDHDGLSFWFDPKVVPRGFAWVFGLAAGSRVGVASYGPSAAITGRLQTFSQRFGDATDRVHGNFFPAAIERPLMGRNVFAAGDSAGHCLPVTGEGIRTAIYFGEQCGRLVRGALDGRLSEAEAAARYADLVASRRQTFIRMRRLQWLVGRLPNPWLTRFAAWAADAGRFQSIMQRYDAIAHPDELTGPV